jgi:hypothetical protein
MNHTINSLAFCAELLKPHIQHVSSMIVVACDYMRRVVPAKRVDSVSRDEFKHAITWEMLTCRVINRCVSGYSFRDTVGKLAVPFPRTNYLRNSFSYSGAVTWNSLPVELRQANSLNSFRSGCNKFLSSRS